MILCTTRQNSNLSSVNKSGTCPSSAAGASIVGPQFKLLPAIKLEVYLWLLVPHCIPGSYERGKGRIGFHCKKLATITDYRNLDVPGSPR
jgi:hypothetical protein